MSLHRANDGEHAAHIVAKGVANAPGQAEEPPGKVADSGVAGYDNANAQDIFSLLAFCGFDLDVLDLASESVSDDAFDCAPQLFR